jgi:hypothetical protein
VRIGTGDILVIKRLAPHHKQILRVLLNKDFLSPKVRDQYWVNPTLFFKGDRVAFITEYRRKKITEQDRLESLGQQHCRHLK